LSSQKYAAETMLLSLNVIMIFITIKMYRLSGTVAKRLQEHFTVYQCVLLCIVQGGAE